MKVFIQTLIMYTPLHQLIQRIVIDMQHRLRTTDRPTLIIIVYYAEAAHKIYTKTAQHTKETVQNTRNSSGDEVANVNFLRHRTRTNKIQ